MKHKITGYLSLLFILVLFLSLYADMIFSLPLFGDKEELNKKVIGFLMKNEK